MVAPLDNKPVFDAGSLDSLRRSAKENSPEALKAVAKQFEAVFMNMMLKSMREASPQESMFNNDQTKMFTSMLDQQLSQNMASKGVGLADVLVRQLSGSYSSTQKTSPPVQSSTDSKASSTLPAAAMNTETAPTNNRPKHIHDFHTKVASSAEAASASTGIPASFMIGQAALESGWGRREIKASDGSSSFNVFGIKATGGWKGKTVDATTTEYVNGVAYKKVERFRAYDSYDAAFKDYANLIKNNPRYEQVIANSKDAHSFAQGLQNAGYATDPHYAAKLSKIIKNSINT